MGGAEPRYQGWMVPSRRRNEPDWSSRQPVDQVDQLGRADGRVFQLAARRGDAPCAAGRGARRRR